MNLTVHGKADFNVKWLKGGSLGPLGHSPSPDMLQQEIIEHLEAALAAFRDVAAGLPVFANSPGKP